MLRQLELADDLGAQQAHDVREDREAEAREELLGDGRAAEDVAPLEDERLHPGAGQVGGADQAVVAAADDDRVVALGQLLPPRDPAPSDGSEVHCTARCGSGGGRSTRRRRPAYPDRPWPIATPSCTRPPTSPRTSSRRCRTGSSARPWTSRRCVPRSAVRYPTAGRMPSRWFAPSPATPTPGSSHRRVRASSGSSWAVPCRRPWPRTG